MVEHTPSRTTDDVSFTRRRQRSSLSTGARWIKCEETVTGPPASCICTPFTDRVSRDGQAVRPYRIRINAADSCGR